MTKQLVIKLIFFILSLKLTGISYNAKVLYIMPEYIYIPGDIYIYNTLQSAR